MRCRAQPEPIPAARSPTHAPPRAAAARTPAEHRLRRAGAHRSTTAAARPGGPDGRRGAHRGPGRLRLAVLSRAAGTSVRFAGARRAAHGARAHDRAPGHPAVARQPLALGRYLQAPPGDRRGARRRARVHPRHAAYRHHQHARAAGARSAVPRAAQLEVAHPFPPPETASYRSDPRIAQVDAELARVDRLLPEFRQHASDGRKSCGRSAWRCSRTTSCR